MMMKLKFEFTEKEMIDALVEKLGDKLPVGTYILSANAIALKRGSKGFMVELYAEKA